MTPLDGQSTAGRADRPPRGQAPVPNKVALIACAVWVVALTAVFMSFYLPAWWLELPFRIAIAALNHLRETVYPFFYRNYVF